MGCCRKRAWKRQGAERVSRSLGSSSDLFGTFPWTASALPVTARRPGLPPPREGPGGGGTESALTPGYARQSTVSSELVRTRGIRLSN